MWLPCRSCSSLLPLAVPLASIRHDVHVSIRTCMNMMFRYMSTSTFEISLRSAIELHLSGFQPLGNYNYIWKQAGLLRDRGARWFFFSLQFSSFMAVLNSLYLSWLGVLSSVFTGIYTGSGLDDYVSVAWAGRSQEWKTRVSLAKRQFISCIVSLETQTAVVFTARLGDNFPPADSHFLNGGYGLKFVYKFQFRCWSWTWLLFISLG